MRLVSVLVLVTMLVPVMPGAAFAQHTEINVVEADDWAYFAMDGSSRGRQGPCFVGLYSDGLEVWTVLRFPLPATPQGMSLTAATLSLSKELAAFDPAWVDVSGIVNVKLDLQNLSSALLPIPDTAPAMSESDGSYDLWHVTDIVRAASGHVTLALAPSAVAQLSEFYRFRAPDNGTAYLRPTLTYVYQQAPVINRSDGARSFSAIKALYQ